MHYTMHFQDNHTQYVKEMMNETEPTKDSELLLHYPPSIYFSCTPVYELWIFHTHINYLHLLSQLRMFHTEAYNLQHAVHTILTSQQATECQEDEVYILSCQIVLHVPQHTSTAANSCNSVPPLPIPASPSKRWDSYAPHVAYFTSMATLSLLKSLTSSYRLPFLIQTLSHSCSMSSILRTPHPLQDPILGVPGDIFTNTDKLHIKQQELYHMIW